MIDTHCHLTDKRLGNVDEVINRAKAAGVEKIIVPASGPKDFFLIEQLTKQCKDVYGLIGVHPGNAEEKIDLGMIEEKITGKILGIGEIGLDCYWNRRDLERQSEVFRMQMELAVKLKKPVAVHCRKAEIKMREVLENMEELPRGQFHCFGESSEFLDYVLSRGFYVSFCCNVTYKNANNLRELLRKVPLDRLLLETDSPYLPPADKRGTVNEPKNVKILAEFEASLLKVPVDTLTLQTTNNALCLYSGI